MKLKDLIFAQKISIFSSVTLLAAAALPTALRPLPTSLALKTNACFAENLACTIMGMMVCSSGGVESLMSVCIEILSKDRPLTLETMFFFRLAKVA